MGYKIERVKIPTKMLDRRVKLLDCQRERIGQMYDNGISIKILARMFGVSRRLISFIAIPGEKAKARKLYVERSKDGRYKDPQKNRRSREDTRMYKETLFKDFGYEQERVKRANNRSAE